MKSIQIIKQKIQTFLRRPETLIIKLLYILSPVLGDRLYLKLLFPLKTGYKLDLENPQTYNEKIQWLKLNYRDPLLPTLVDKYEYKKYVKKKLGEKHVVETYGVWNTIEEIDFSKLPSKFVLKTTHDQGGVVICKDKSTLELEKVKKKLNKHLSQNIYYRFREWPYKNVEPRIMAEKLLIDKNRGNLWDYKFYCFHGEPQIMYISMGRQGNHVPLYYFDMDFNLLNVSRPRHEPDDKQLEKPRNWQLMIGMAKKLSSGQPHVRIDFYNINNQIFAGEYTLFQGGGMMPFIPRKWDYKMGSYLNLPK